MDTSLVGKDLRGQDLAGHDLTGKILFGTDLRGAGLRGATITLSCETFSGAKFDTTQVALLLLMLAKADIPDSVRDNLHTAAREAVGERLYDIMKRYLQVM